MFPLITTILQRDFVVTTIVFFSVRYNVTKEKKLLTKRIS